MNHDGFPMAALTTRGRRRLARALALVLVAGVLWQTGFLLPASLRLAPFAVQAVFVGNLAWMIAAAGILYQQADRQLSLSYPTDMQTLTSRGLVVAGALLVAFWSTWAWRKSRAV